MYGWSPGQRITERVRQRYRSEIQWQRVELYMLDYVCSTLHSSPFSPSRSKGDGSRGSRPQWQRFSTSNHSKICFSATSQAIFETGASAPFIRLSRRRRLLRHLRRRRTNISAASARNSSTPLLLLRSFFNAAFYAAVSVLQAASVSLLKVCGDMFRISQGKSSFTIPISGLVEIWS